MAKRLSPQDMLFLYGETPSSMMHVAALMPFTPPDDAPANYLRQMFEETRHLEVVEPWNLKLSHPRMLFRPDQSWVKDEKFDIDYHVRRSALASPGDERELGILVSRLHSQNIDFTRPPWELHFIEGLEGGRFAIYMKIHHSLVDGYTGNKILERSMSTDPTLRDQPLFFNVGPPSKKRSKTPAPPRNPVMSLVGGLLGGAVGGAQSVLNVGKALYNTQIRSDDEYGQITNSFQAPHSILNKHISRNRRFATQVYPFERLKSIGSKHDATVNDVALTIIGGGLRAFLDQLGELPEKPLVAFLPVNIRPKDDVGGGNAVGTILTTMGTDIEDPVDRLHTITASTKAAKGQLQNMSQTEVLAYTAGLMAPTAFQLASAMTGVRGPLPFTFNLCVSNVPGPRETLYLNGSRLEATYPVSIPMHGMALNITLESYADTLNFGFVGCRDALPHLQRLAVYTGDALDELDKLA
ncbi:acyltransferase, WS/DGAT/MGAT [Mycolicibacterium rhodesiae NBB3]|uniref:Diacylglycerol O-acyltransferase n=2 Tax=Mycolicibacterium rhodesiae TaxID=36814 RepID=G8RV40_MYCRN|nr:wax ester/triacylglycerol synthase family O-acyltransferase [Mycolicibacterium rhodesiae]AEV71721.1 acyltransferase, WS/DGAT/MGAT [Mycolicibacterium rhodesiae NBB3]